MTSRTASANSNQSTAHPRDSETAIQRNFLSAFYDLLRTDMFKEEFDFRNMVIPKFYRWILYQDVANEADHPITIIRQQCRIKMAKTGDRTKAASTKQVEEQPQKYFDVLDKSQIRQIVRAALAIHTYSQNDGRIDELFRSTFVNGKSNTKLLIGTAFLTRIVGGAKRINLPLNPASKIEALLYFHCIRLYEKERRAAFVAHGNRVGYILQTIVDCWSRLVSNIKVENVGRLSILIMPYVIFKHNTGLFEMIKSRDEGFSNSGMERRLESCKVVKESTQVSSTAWNRSAQVDMALRYIVNMLFVKLETTLERPYLYSANEKDLVKWNELRKYKVPTNVEQVSTVFSNIPTNIASTLQLEIPQQADSSEDADENVIVDLDDEKEK